MPILGASCDRIVKTKEGELGILEIKTLSKAKTQNYTLQEAVDNKAAPWIDVDKNHKFFVKPNCKHITQINGQMALTGLKWCDLIVDCGLEFVVQWFHFDKNLWLNVMMPKLLNFCAEHFVHK